MPIKHITPEEEYKKTQKLKKEDIKHLQEWAERQPHLPKISEFQMILFLHSCYHQIELAKKTIDSYYTFRTHCPEFFTDRTFKNEWLVKTNQMSYFTLLPDCTPEGYRAILFKLVNNDLSLFDLAAVIKRNMMLTDLWNLEHGTQEGIICIVDLEGATFGHFTKLGLFTMRKYISYLQEALPVRLKAFHYINTPSFMDKVMALIKTLMNKELIEVTYLWNSNVLDKFYEKVPQKIMPKEYGGQHECHKVLLERQHKYLEDNLDSFIFDELNNRVDESKRIKETKSTGDLFIEWKDHFKSWLLIKKS